MKMKLAAAQLKVEVGALDKNLKKHITLIDIAIKNKVDLIVFPEMSLTGYCRAEGKKLAVSESSLEIRNLKNIAERNNIIIVVGAPIEIKSQVYIGSYILMPNGKVEIYTKQFLHAGEEDYYAPSFDYNPIIKIKDETILFAICADIDNEQHALNAKQDHCSLYISSIFFSEKGIGKGHQVLADYANKYAFKILMSNYCGEIWGIKSGGKSGFWNDNGKLVAELDIDNEGLLIIEKKGNHWVPQKYLIKGNDLL